MKHIIFILILCVGCLTTTAQLAANFTEDKTFGCTSVTVNFNNTSTGTSVAATYLWNFGNGTTSSLQSPTAVFNGAGVYNVTLTVFDCKNTSTKTQQIAVYNPPVVDFSSTPLNKCLPLNVAFKSNSTAGDGSIGNYYWQFGDGQAISGNSYNQTTHTYTYAQTPVVSLTVTNTYGCSTTASKSDVDAQLQSVNPFFSADQRYLCQTNNQVSFVNSTTGPGVLSYIWDFGDGSTSTDVAPKHTYKDKGDYTVKLTATTSLGCTADYVQVNYMSVANFTVDFTVPALICTNTNVNFIDQSVATYNSTSWYVDGQPANGNYNYYPASFVDTASHTIKLTHTFGTCTVSKSKTVKANATPVLNGFVANIQGGCTAPVTVTFTDTTKGAAKWQWSNNYPVFSNPFATTKSTTYTFPSLSNYYIGLTVTSAAGCTASNWQNIDLSKPVVGISINSLDGSNGTSGCIGLKDAFSASPSAYVKTYQWNFGDGSTSTSANPTHQYNQAGSFTVTLTYTTTDGCSGTVSFKSITVIANPTIDFTTLPGTNICGSSPVTFVPTPQLSGWYYSWTFGDNGYSGDIQPVHQYLVDSVYTVSLIIQNGGCKDTMVKKNYIKVNPGFAAITGQTNTCNGTRGEVTLTQTSRKINQWIWDFGDGSGTVTYYAEQDTVKHIYNKSGSYNVTLKAINGGCTAVNTVTAKVLLKQSPQLSLLQLACGNDTSKVTINNLDANPASSGAGYGLTGTQYTDLTSAPYPLYYNSQFNGNVYNGNIVGLNTSQAGIRAITQSVFFYCYDTTNFAPIKVTGPKAGFSFSANQVCFKNPVQLTDTSVADASNAIKKWVWNFGDGTTATESNGNTVLHTYATPGQYPVTVTVTDAAGCSSTSLTQYAVSSGPKANFSVSQNPAGINTTVYFYNNSNSYNAYNTSYTWLFPNGSVSNVSNTSYIFTALGTDTVTLIANNNNQTCADTAYQIITVKRNAAFTFATSVGNIHGCPPVTVNFTETATYLSQVWWDFGDGSQGGNQTTISHVYNNPGIYRVVLHGYDAAYNIASIADSVIVKGPFASLDADKLTACDSLTVELTATVKDVASLTWNFGDNTSSNTTDTFATHTYTVPGIYRPQVTVKDTAGCTGTALLPCKIIIDDIKAAITNVPPIVCDSALVYFKETVKSIAKDSLQMPLQYHWDFGQSGGGYDTNNPDTASHKYNQTGQYYTNLTITSPYGCKTTVTDTVLVRPVSKASISGPTDMCTNSPTPFTGTATNFTDSLSWTWNFYDNNNTLQLQGPVNATYQDSGTYSITLIVNNNGCYDTAVNVLHVHSSPTLTIVPLQPIVCLGNSVTLTASGAVAYIWQQGNGVTVNGATNVITPKISDWYHVQGASTYGCKRDDSVWVKVDAPFKLKTNDTLNICIGSTAQFNVTGADKYNWIAGTGLSNTQIGSPTVTTTTPQTYTVVGYDNDGCFTDTASIQAVIKARPTVSVSPNAVTINAGSDIQLITNASADVTQYSWTPHDYLSCFDCSSPLSTPKLPVTYTVTATNGFGCTAFDTARLELFCSQGLIFIPSAFTPNNDQANDRFVIKGGGIRLIKRIAIFNRYGDKVFERKSIGSDDYANSWDGTINGIPSPTGAYVYIAQIECLTGDTYNYKGTIVLVR